MGRVGADLLAAGVILAACAGRGAPASETPASIATAQSSSECQQSPQPASPWREMTWAEYYADVSERASRRDVEVIWITPPDVRQARKAESSATPVAACKH
jgi:hypothetical protein